MRCLFSNYKSSYCLVGKESVYIYIYIYMCAYTCVCVYWTVSVGQVTVFVMLTLQWFLVKDPEFTFSFPSQKVQLLAFFCRLICLVQFNQFARICLPVGNQSNSPHKCIVGCCIKIVETHSLFLPLFEKEKCVSDPAKEQ